MCDPITALSAALTIGGTIMQAKGQQAAVDEQNRMLNLERARQNELSHEAQAVQAQSLNDASRPAQDKAQAQNQQVRQAAYTSGVNQSTYAAPITTKNAVIQGEADRASGAAEKTGLAEAIAKAALDAYGDTGLQTGFKLNRNAGKIGGIADMSAGSSAVLPYEMQNAQRKGQGLRSLGDLLVAGGQIAGGFAGGGGGLFDKFAGTSIGPLPDSVIMGASQKLNPADLIRGVPTLSFGPV